MHLIVNQPIHYILYLLQCSCEFFGCVVQKNMIVSIIVPGHRVSPHWMSTHRKEERKCGTARQSDQKERDSHIEQVYKVLAKRF